MWSVLVAGLLLCVASQATAADHLKGPESALRKYVGKADDSYKWVKRREGEIAGVKFVELTLTSQTWRGIPWKHQLYLFKPEVVDGNQAVMLISGGAWKDELEQPAKEGESIPQEATVLAGVVKQLKAPVVLINHVPFQPMFDGMTEDEIISYTFEQYLKTGEEDWPALLPMAKSAVRAMDAAQEYAQKEWNLDIKNFTVTGASKRGWTTWLTGAVDDRATAIAPMVIDVLNMPAQMKHQLETWGKYSEQIEDYTRRGIQSAEETEAGKKLNAIVDPYSYREILDQPKLLIMGTNDRYWTLDALNLYWNDLSGEKRVLYIPNNGHGINDFRRIVGGLCAMHRQARGELTLPQMKWDLKQDGDSLKLSLGADAAPKKVLAWMATSPTKDFRESKWTSKPIETVVDGQYQFELPVPTEGYAALFGEAEFAASGIPYFLSTNVRIVGGGGTASAGGQ